MKVVLLVLHGVGDTSQKHIERGGIAIHYRRPMTESEIAKIPKTREDYVREEHVTKNVKVIWTPP